MVGLPPGCLLDGCKSAQLVRHSHRLWDGKVIARRQAAFGAGRRLAARGGEQAERSKLDRDHDGLGCE